MRPNPSSFPSDRRSSGVSMLRKLVLAAVVVATAIFGQPAAFGQDLKVGFVNVPRVMDAAPQAKAARERIDDEFAPRDRELVLLQRELNEHEDLLVKNSAIMSSTELNRLEEEVRRLRRELRRSQEEFREDLNLRRSQELSKLQRKITEVIQWLANSDDYDIILTDGVVFAGERVDITQRVIDRLRVESESGN